MVEITLLVLPKHLHVNPNTFLTQNEFTKFYCFCSARGFDTERDFKNHLKADHEIVHRLYQYLVNFKTKISRIKFSELVASDRPEEVADWQPVRIERLIFLIREVNKSHFGGNYNQQMAYNTTCNLQRYDKKVKREMGGNP